MPNVEIAARVFASKIVGILRQAGSVAKMPIRPQVIEGMGKRVTCHSTQAMVVPGRESRLQSVVVGPVDVSHLKNIAQVREPGIKRPGPLFISRRADVWIVA